ncbi:MAG TPA: hypothetical protein VJA21_32850 [Verrucomicrobiae bacterium]
MRCLSPKPAPERASVLLVALALSVILGMTLAGYLSWVRTQNVLVAESQAWNAALAHAEAGIEEGLAQINVSFGTNYLPSAQTNWSGASASGFYVQRTDVFKDKGGYRASIIPDTPGPTIISTGYAVVPLVGRRIVRTVEVRTKPDAAFGYAIAVLQNVTMGGNYVMIDSYDSRDPLHSTSMGTYDPNTRKAGGDVISTDGFVSVGGANIYGHVRTAPWGGISVQQSNGRVGDLEVNWPNRSGIEDGWYANDLNLDFNDVGEPFKAPTASFPAPDANTNYVLGAYDYLITTNFQLLNGATLSASNGTARLWVQGDFRCRQGSAIMIAPGARLEVYTGTLLGPPVSAEINNVNTTGYAENFGIYGLPSTTTMSWSGNNTFNGTIYAPQAIMALKGSGFTSTNDFQGSCVTRALTLQGHFNFHFDESLVKTGPSKGYTVTSWREL